MTVPGVRDGGNAITGMVQRPGSCGRQFGLSQWVPVQLPGVEISLA
jgi:hypothetical protein